jgi:hypothetical protein
VNRSAPVAHLPLCRRAAGKRVAIMGAGPIGTHEAALRADLSPRLEEVNEALLWRVIMELARSLL